MTSSKVGCACGMCGLPVTDAAFWIKGSPYHDECFRAGPHWSPAVSQPASTVTEDDVRRIIREEIGRIQFEAIRPDPHFTYWRDPQAGRSVDL